MFQLIKDRKKSFAIFIIFFFNNILKKKKKSNCESSIVIR